MNTSSCIEVDVVETVLEVLAEGGSLSVMRRNTQPPTFSARQRDQSLVLIDEGDEIVRHDPWGSWEAATKALDRYPWRKLYPALVHADHAEDVWNLVVEDRSSLSDARLEAWSEACGRPKRN